MTASLNVKADIHFKLASDPVNTAPVFPPSWLVTHDNPVRAIVLARGVPLPEINPLLPNGFFPLDEAWQWLWKDINPELSPRDWRALLQYQRAFTNQNGFDKPGDPRRDYINGRDLEAVDDQGNPAYPKMELLLCGGAVVTGRAEGEWLWVDVLDGNQPPPSAAWVLAHPEFSFRAVSINPRGEINNLTQGGQGLAKRVPIVSKYPVKFALNKVRRLRDDEIVHTDL